MPVDLIGFAYATTVAAGGVFGYIKAGTSSFDFLISQFFEIFLPFVGSVPSLAAGLAFGTILSIGAYYTSQERPQPLLQLGTALALGGMMGMRWAKSGKFMPPGFICVLSVLVLGRGLVTYNRYLPILGSRPREA